jgi:hypothetical protein
MKVLKPIRILSWFFLALGVFCVWYMVAADFGYEAVSGKYRFQQGGESSTLLLDKDRTFLQDRNREGKIERAQGVWHRSGEGGIEFSKEFLSIGLIPPDSDGFTYGEVQKSFLELIPSIVLGPDRDHGPRFHRQMFH